MQKTQKQAKKQSRPRPKNITPKWPHLAANDWPQGPANSQEVLNRFLADESLVSLPVVNKETVPAVLIQRQRFVEFFTRPYVRELYGRMEVLAFIQGEKYPFVNSRPIIVEESTRIDDVAQMIIGAGMENMVTGFIVTRDGRYQGMANGHGLLNEITQRKQADLYYAAHFDHLTGIPNRLLLSDRLAHACLDSAQ